MYCYAHCDFFTSDCSRLRTILWISFHSIHNSNQNNFNRFHNVWKKLIREVHFITTISIRISLNGRRKWLEVNRKLRKLFLYFIVWWRKMATTIRTTTKSNYWFWFDITRGHLIETKGKTRTYRYCCDYILIKSVGEVECSSWSSEKIDLFIHRSFTPSEEERSICSWFWLWFVQFRDSMEMIEDLMKERQLLHNHSLCSSSLLFSHRPNAAMESRQMNRFISELHRRLGRTLSFKPSFFEIIICWCYCAFGRPAKWTYCPEKIQNLVNFVINLEKCLKQLNLL